MDEPDMFRIVCVCTGNVCRSPVAERLLASALGPSVAVSSAGTLALVGQPMSAPMDALVGEAGADPAGFTAQVLSAARLRDAGLVLAMTRAHRSAIVEVAPATVRRCFTLREYARLLGLLPTTALPEGSPGERAAASIRPAAAQRRQAAADQDDIADPYRRGDHAYRVAFDQVRTAVDQIAHVLAPSRTVSPGQPTG